MPKRKAIEAPVTTDIVVAGAQFPEVFPKVPAKSSKGGAVGITQQFQKSLEKMGVDTEISVLLKFAAQSFNQDIETVPTMFPQANLLFYPGRPGMPPGMPRGRIMELYSKETGVGKSSWAIRAIAAWQHQYYKAILADPDGKNTVAYMKQQGCVVDELDPRKMALVKIEPPNRRTTLSAEQWLEALRKYGPLFDLVVLDSIAGLQQKHDLHKGMNDANKVGGLGQMLGNFCKEMIGKQTTVLFTNQSRYAPGHYSPTGVAWAQVGGRAVRNFASIRAEMSLTPNGEITDSKKNVLGFKVDLKTVKNNLSIPGRKCTLTLLEGLGLSPWWDYLEIGRKLGIIHHKGGTHTFEKWTGKSERNFHYQLVHDPELFGRLREVIDDKTIAQALTGDAEEPTKEEQEREAEEDARAQEEFAA